MKVLYRALTLLMGVSFTIGVSAQESFYHLSDEAHTQSKLPMATLVLGGDTFHVELAQTQEQQMYGLMNRLMLPQRTGMLFVFDHMDYRSFWMKNTKVPLDIIYIDNSGIIVNIQKAMPCLKDPCPTYPSQKEAQYVLEVAQGETDRLGVVVGDLLIKLNAKGHENL